MRIAGIILIFLGGLMIASQFLVLAGRTEQENDKGLSAQQQRMDALIPGAIVAVVGFALILFSKRSSTITATTADQWFSITLTPEAVRLVKDRMAERSYSSGEGLRVVEGSNDALVVQFDLPPDSDEDCVAEDQGVSVFTEKSLVSRVAGKLIDIRDETMILVSPSSPQESA
jgi:hypothetical protein